MRSFVAGSRRKEQQSDTKITMHWQPNAKNPSPNVATILEHPGYASDHDLVTLRNHLVAEIHKVRSGSVAEFESVANEMKVVFPYLFRHTFELAF